MDKYTMNIKSKNLSDKAVSTTIGYINPEAQPSELKALAQGLVALTKNTYQSADRIETINVDTAPDVPAKTARNIAMAVTKINPSDPSSNLVQDIANDVTEVDAIVPANGTLQIWLKNNNNDVDVFPTYSYVSEDGITAEFYYTQKNLYGDGNGYVENKWKIFSYAAGKSITFTVNLAESAAYAAYTRTITFNLVSAS